MTHSRQVGAEWLQRFFWRFSEMAVKCDFLTPENVERDMRDFQSRTRSAVEKLFDAVHSYDDMLDNPHRPAIVLCRNTENFDALQNAWMRDNKEAIQERLVRDSEYAYNLFAKSTLCGAILQFAYKAIELESKNTFIPKEIKELFNLNEGNKIVKYWVGRSFADIPIGLVIYAGRNEAHHFEANLGPVVKYVFEHIKQKNNDPRFDLSNKEIENHASIIIHALGWKCYDDYRGDIEAMLK